MVMFVFNVIYETDVHGEMLQSKSPTPLKSNYSLVLADVNKIIPKHMLFESDTW